MWRFDLIVTVTVMMMMHMYLHLGGRGYYYYVCVCVGVFLFLFGLRASVRRGLSMSKTYYSLAALHDPIYAPSRSFQKGSRFQKKKGRVGVISVDE